MTQPPMIRIFFAIDLPEPHKKTIGEYISRLKRESKSHNIRWTRPENLHVTLQFLAEVNAKDISDILHHVRLHLQDFRQSLVLQLGNLQLFPSAYRPRVIVLAIEPQSLLAQIAALIGYGIAELQYPLDARAFRGHLTVGRIKHSPTQLKFLETIAPPTLEPMPTPVVTLFRSEPQADGSKYTILDTIRINRLDEKIVSSQSK